MSCAPPPASPRARSSCCTGAAPTSTTCCRSSTCSTRAAGSSGSRPGGPLHLPPGGRHWYVVPRVGFPDHDTFHASLDALCAFLDAIPDALGVPWERIVLGGFSQGGVMSYAVGPRRRAPAPGAASSRSAASSRRSTAGRPTWRRAPALPVWIAHGRRDPVIGVEFGRAARDLLTAGGLDVTYDESDAAHHVDPRSIAELPGWIERALERA